MNTNQRLITILILCLLADGPIIFSQGQIVDPLLCLQSQPPSACLFEATAGFDQCVNPLLHVCFYQGDTSGLVPRDLGENTTLPSNGGSIVCNFDGSCGEEPIPNRDTCCGICKSCTYQNCCNCIFTDPGQYCPIPGLF